MAHTGRQQRALCCEAMSGWRRMLGKRRQQEQAWIQQGFIETQSALTGIALKAR